jgi:hypothetical protein
MEIPLNQELQPKVIGVSFNTQGGPFLVRYGHDKSLGNMASTVLSRPLVSLSHLWISWVLTVLNNEVYF